MVTFAFQYLETATFRVKTITKWHLLIQKTFQQDDYIVTY